MERALSRRARADGGVAATFKGARPAAAFSVKRRKLLRIVSWLLPLRAHKRRPHARPGQQSACPLRHPVAGRILIASRTPAAKTGSRHIRLGRRPMRFNRHSLWAIVGGILFGALAA